MVRVKVPTLSEESYKILKQQILSGELRPGYKINLEQCAAAFGVSATPIREALLKLQQEQLAEYLPRAGWRVTRLSRAKYLKYYEMQRLLEIALTIQTKPLITGEHIERMESLNENMRAQVAGTENLSSIAKALLALNDEFHMIQYKLYPNDVMIDTLQQVWDATNRQRLIMVSSDSYIDRFHDEHKDIIEALKQENDAVLLQVIHIHCDSAIKDLEKEFEPHEAYTPSWIKYSINMSSVDTEDMKKNSNKKAAPE